MAGPAFTALNGQIHTPLRLYRNRIEPYWSDEECMTEDDPEPYAIPTTLTHLPPFQGWGVLVDPDIHVVSWQLESVDGTTVFDMNAYSDQITVKKFTEHYYLIHDGFNFGGILPANVPLMSVIGTSDGEYHFSEMFSAKCGQIGAAYDFDLVNLCNYTWSIPGIYAIGSINYSGEPASVSGVIVSGAGTAAANGTYTPNGTQNGKNAYINGSWQIFWFSGMWWISNGSIHYRSTDDVLEPGLVTTWTTSGTALPVPTVTNVTAFTGAVDGDVVINLEDGTLYELEGGVWGVSTPADGTQYYDCAGARWYLMNAGSWTPISPAPFRPVNGELCFSGSGFAVDDVILSTPNNSGILNLAILNVTITGMTAGSFGVTVGGSNETFTSNGAHEILTFVGAGGFSIFFSADFDGCVSLIRLRGYEDDCYATLEWTNCGNVGNTYYEDGFVNRYLLPKKFRARYQTAAVGIEGTQNGDKAVTDTFGRKETEWRIDFDSMPWFLAEALKDIELHDTVRIVREQDLGTDVLLNTRVDVQWEEGSPCLAKVSLYFQLDDAVVCSSCCDTWDPLCTAIPIDGNLADLATWDLNGGSEFSTALGTEDVAGTPSPDPDMSGYVINLGDNLLYYFEKDTATWNAPVLTEGEIWFDDSGSQFYQMLSGVWTLMTTDAPVTAGANGLCFATSQRVEWSCTLPAPIPTGTSIRVRFIIYGVGTGAIFIASEFITWSGEGIYEEDITLTSDGYGLSFVPDSPFTGCLRAISLCALVP